MTGLRPMLLFAGLLAPCAAAAEEAADDLTSLSVEQLLDIEVTIVSKSGERAGDAAAALSVITQEDIRRSGATSFPEALRLSPGLHVSKVSSSIWEVSSRGFSSVTSAKLLVLIDGRSVYTPLFSGVFWDVQDTVLADVDRIEVVRGPGATLWGSNAMNGVINILTKSARDTQGAYVEAGGGNEHRGFASARYGGRIGDSAWYRVYAKAFTDDGGFNPNGPDDDDWRMGRVGFRVDADVGKSDSLTFQGEGYLGEVGQVVPALAVTNRPPPMPPLTLDIAGGNVNAAYTHRFGPRSDLVARVTYDRSHRDDPTFRDDLDTVDVSLQSRLALPANQELVLGIEYRLMHDRFVGKGIAELRPPTSVDHLISGFAQDTLSLFDDSLRVTLGAKLEHNDFSGLEFQPGLRIAWDPARGHTLWGAVARAVRVPTRIERDIFADASAPSDDPAIQLFGNPNLGAEELLAGELGYRWRASPNLSVDLAGYYFRYDSLIDLEFGTPFVEGGRTILPVLAQNQMHGHSFGGEASIAWAPIPAWKLIANYSFCKLELTPDAMDPTGGQLIEGATPRHQVSVRSSLNLPAGFRFDAFFRWVDSIETPAPTSDYASADARLAWEGWKKVEISVVGQSLLEAHHREFPGGTEVQRSVYGKVAVWF